LTTYEKLSENLGLEEGVNATDEQVKEDEEGEVDN
jgi:hypothetical protein